MSKSTIAFDLDKAKLQSRIIKAEADKVSRQADKLERAVRESFDWWVGDSHARFVKRAEALIKGMRKAAEKINNMSETMTNAGEFWKEEEERIARELRALGSLMEGAIQPASDGKKIKEKEKGSDEALKFIQEVEDKGVPFPKDWSHSDKVEFSYRYLSELDDIFMRIDGRYETTDKLVNYDIAKMAEEEFLFLSDLDLAMILTLEQRLRVRELFIEDRRYLNKVQDYLIESGFSKDEAKSLSLKVSSAFIASEQGMSYHDWYTFLVAISFLDGASKLEHSIRPLKDLHDNWKAQRTKKIVLESGEITIPDKAFQIARQVAARNGAPPQGYKGGKTFSNQPVNGGQKLPDGIIYREYDINPYIKGQNRGAERIVIGSDGSVWYTNDHYHTFIKILP